MTILQVIYKEKKKKTRKERERDMKKNCVFGNKIIKQKKAIFFVDYLEKFRIRKMTIIFIKEKIEEMRKKHLSVIKILY